MEKIHLERVKLAKELDQMIQKYTLKGLNHSKFWEMEIETLETYKRLIGVDD